jgi:CxxC-x17-CxxC domain-containing protein
MARARKGFHRRSSKRKVPARSFKVTCSRCGKELMMEVPPPPGKDLLCLDCYNK